MNQRRSYAPAIVGVVAAVFALRPALPAGQAPNQAQMVTQTVAGVKFSTLPGFAIERVNPPDKSDSYVALTFDSGGRLVVSKEHDHPRLLTDADQDGVYEGEKVLTDKVRNCQGLWFDGPAMYASCVHVQKAAEAAAAAPPPAAGGGRGGSTNPPTRPAGVFRLEDTNGDDVMDTMDVLSMTGSIQEHGPHAIRRRPDGGIAVMIGNHETVEDAMLDLQSPVLKDKDAQFLPYFPNFGTSAREGAHSAIYEWHPERKKFTVFSGGNRNSYDFAYNLAGEAFLFDSDMEWDIGLPWYREVRTVHQVLNGNYGYRNGSGKYPAYYIDSLPPTREVGRGSPVGVEFYTSYAYPKEFFDNLFEADWSRGRLLYTAVTPAGATYTARSDRAEIVHGEPFNVTDVEVGPDGMLYFTTGGRNTTGGLWRLRYSRPVPAAPDMSGILAVVRQPQPLSSWGWTAIEKVKRSMGAAFASELEKLARSASAAAADRSRAVYEMQRHGAAPDGRLLKALIADASADVRAAAVYVAGIQGEGAKAVVGAALRDRDPMVRRRAGEALVRMGQSPEKPSLAPVADVYALLNDRDRFVRWAGRIAIEHTARAEWQDRVLKETNPFGAVEGMLAWVRTANGESLEPIVEKAFVLMKAAAQASAAGPDGWSPENKLRLFRTLQYTTTEMKGGLSPAQREQLYGLIAGQFPAQDERLNRELALLIGYSGQAPGIGELLDAMPKGNEKQELQLHYLYALRMLKEGWTPAQKVQLAELLGRASRWRGGAQFINFVGQFFDAVADLYSTDDEKQLLYEKAPDFSPLTPEELTALQERQAAAAAAGRGGRGRGNTPPSPLAARTQGRVVSRQEMLEEAVYQPQQNLSVDEGRALFEANCASCHRFGTLGADHGVAGLNLTASPLRSSKYALLEAIMFPDRKLAPNHETTVITTADGKTIRGLLLRENGRTVSLLGRDGATADVPKGEIKSRTREKTSLMTEAMADAMNQAQWRNLLAFLTAAPPGATQPQR